jgi:TonB family protein
MVKYFTISLVVNLFLFYLYTLWIGENLLNAFKGFEKALPPLQVSIKFEEREKQKEGKNKNKAATGKKHSVKQRVKPKKSSLLKTLLPSVEKEFKAFYRKVHSSAQAKLEKGKFKLTLNRKLLYVPKMEPITVEIPPAPAVVKITILPDGRVAEVKFIKRSGNAKVDRAILKFLKNLKFEPISEYVIQEITVTFTF